MLLTMLLLGAVYVVLIAVLVAAGAGVAPVAVIAGALFLTQYFSCDRAALSALRARAVSPGAVPQLHATVDRLCIEADLPTPKLALVDTPMPNACSVGRSPATATVCVTTGLLELVDDGELEAVLAHELSHIENRDVMLMTIAGFFASIAAFIVGLGSRAAGEERGDGGAGGSVFAVVVIVSGLVYVVSFVLTQALSRARELAADRGAALITGRPGAIASALMKISDRIDGLPQRDLRAACGELGAFYIVAPDVTRTVAGLFATHPPLAARLAALARLESQLQRAG